MSHYFSKGKNNKTITSLFELFLKPFVGYYFKVKEMTSLYGILDIFFHTETRVIVDAKALKYFKMPGNLVLGNVVVPGYGEKRVLKGKELLIRYDRTSPNWYDIQHDMGATEQVFRLTSEDFASIRDFIKVDDEEFDELRHRDNRLEPEDG